MKDGSENVCGLVTSLLFRIQMISKEIAFSLAEIGSTLSELMNN